MFPWRLNLSPFIDLVFVLISFLHMGKHFFKNTFSYFSEEKLSALLL